MEPRNLFYTKTFIFLLITFLSGSIPNIVDMQKSGVSLEKTLYLVVSALGAIGITIDKMEKEPNVFTAKGLGGRDLKDAQANVQKTQATQLQTSMAIAEQSPVEISQSETITDALVDAIPQIKVSQDLQPVVDTVQTFAAKSLLKRIFK